MIDNAAIQYFVVLKDPKRFFHAVLARCSLNSKQVQQTPVNLEPPLPLLLVLSSDPDAHISTTNLIQAATYTYT
jgi:hypothetical protein